MKSLPLLNLFFFSLTFLAISSYFWLLVFWEQAPLTLQYLWKLNAGMGSHAHWDLTKVYVCMCVCVCACVCACGREATEARAPEGREACLSQGPVASKPCGASLALGAHMALESRVGTQREGFQPSTKDEHSPKRLACLEKQSGFCCERCLGSWGSEPVPHR